MSQKTENKHISKKLLITFAVVIAILGCLLFVIIEAANAGEKLQESDSFGLGNQRFSINAPVGVISSNLYEAQSTYDSSHTSLATYSTRDISTALSSISYKIELAAQAAAAAAHAEEMAKINVAKNKRNEHALSYGMPPNLEEINWDQGKDSFIAEWTMRINKYFLGTPMANTGEIFANAAWDNGIDPRWSPAISNTESSKGFACFNECNAWGWGDSYWSNWYDAINGHVAGLSESYGYTITRGFAEKYCPPNSDNWYNNTLSEMLKI